MCEPSVNPSPRAHATMSGLAKQFFFQYRHADEDHVRHLPRATRPYTAPRRGGHRRQRGMAVIAALLVVALAASLTASIVWRELVALRDVENQRMSLQTLWLERAALQWARATLREQSAQSNALYLGEAWSMPVRDLRLADILPDGTRALNGEVASASVSGEMVDAQARFNLADLVSRPGPGAPWQVDPNGLRVYRQLLGELAIAPALAQNTADYMLRSLSPPSGDAAWPLQLTSVADLGKVPGYDAGVIDALAPQVTLLPDYTYVNANTADPQVLAAAIPRLSVEQAHRLTEHRQTAYFNSTGDIALALSPAAGTSALPDNALVAVNSGYFIVRCRIRSAHLDARVEALIGRYGLGDFASTRVIWMRRLSTGPV
jgi:general secretion pathway protein K